MGELELYIEEFVTKYKEIVGNSGVDCAELAEWLMEFLKEKKIYVQLLNIIPESSKNKGMPPYGGEFFKIRERNHIEEYIYHCVVYINNYIIDVRHNPNLIEYGKYKEEIEELNKNTKILFTLS